MLQLERLNVILDIFAALFLAGLHAFAGLLEHDHFKLHLSLLFKQLVALILQLLQPSLVLVDHALLQSLILLVQLESLLPVYGERLELRFDLIGDRNDVIRVKELISEQQIFVLLADWSSITSVETAASGACLS